VHRVDVPRPSSARIGVQLVLVASLLAAVLVPPGTAAGDPSPDPAAVQRTLQLLAGIGSEYREAFDDQGKLIRPLDVDETRLLLAEVSDLTGRPPMAGDLELQQLMLGLASVIDDKVPPEVVAAFTEVVRRYLIEVTGVHEAIVPPERPSPARGAALFRDNCTGCHGVGGAGDGADVKQLGITPANFTDLEFMRGETPRDSFNAITLGRPKNGMPAWGDAFSAQQIWDLVAYVWSLSSPPASAAAGQRIYAAQCAGCHGPNGDPAESQAASLQRPSRSLAAILDRSEHSDADVFTVVSTGVAGTPMPAFGATLSEADRWAVVSFLRTLSLAGAPGTDAGALEPDRAAELADVRRVVDAAVEARRRGDPDAHAIATNAYLRFEPLERFLAEKDAARVEALEQSFVTFRSALRDPSKGDPDALGRQLSADLDAAAALLRPSGAPGSAPAPWPRAGLAILAGLVLAAGAYLVRIHARRAVPEGDPAS
jgi:mono/diheme cytochrome c family protein